MQKSALIMIVVLLAMCAAQAATVDFEVPAYSTGNVSGQDGWTVSGGTANVAANGNLSGLQELGVNTSGTAYRNFDGSNFAENTTFSFMAGRATGLEGRVRLGLGNDTSDAIVHVSFTFSNGIYAYDGTSQVQVWNEFDANEVYEITCDIDFDAQSYGIVIENLTVGTSASLSDLDFYSVKSLSQFEAAGGTVRIDASFNTLFVDDISIAEPPFVWPPFHEDFENNATNAGVIGALNGQNGWMAGAGSVVQSNAAYNGSQALKMQNSVASHLFEGTAPATNMQVTFNAWVRADDEVPESTPDEAAALFFVGANQRLVVYSNTVPVELDVVVETNRWTEFSVACNYAAQTWSLRVDGVAVADGLPFYSAQTRFSELTIIEKNAAGNHSYVDGVTIAQRFFTEDDTDGDGLLDEWEIFYYGGIWINPSDRCEGGIHAVWEAYVAGFDPTDPFAYFGIAGISAGTGSGHILQWDETTGRVYTIYWSSNLLDGFSTVLQSNYTGGAFTDTVHNACSEGFYRLDVELAP